MYPRKSSLIVIVGAIAGKGGSGGFDSLAVEELGLGSENAGGLKGGDGTTGVGDQGAAVGQGDSGVDAGIGGGEHQGHKGEKSKLERKIIFLLLII